MLSVIIPVFNRRENLMTCLHSIRVQNKPPELEIIIVDDGSTDGLKEWFYQNYSSGLFYLNDVQTAVGVVTPSRPIRYLSGGPNKGFRGGRARNIAAFNCNGDRVVFVDSDIVLNEGALRSYQEAAEENPDVIIVGMYHWLPPMRWAGHLNILTTSKSLTEVLERAAKVGIKEERDNDSPFGNDERWRDFTDDIHAIRESDGLGALSGNISYPISLFNELGGFDERIVGHGGEDADLGLTAGSKKTKWLFYKPVHGFHLWHVRDQERNHREVQANIAFIDKKHGVGKYRDAEKFSDSQDWSDPIHYHHHLSSILIKKADSPEVSVYRDGHYMKISSPKILVTLGFTWSDVEIVDEEFFAKAKHEGDIIDPTPPEPVYAQQPEQPQPTTQAQALTPPPFDEMKVDNYRKSMGTVAIRSHDSQTVFLVRGEFKLAITHPDWMQRLGFTFDDVKVVAPHIIDQLKLARSTPESRFATQGDPQ